MTEQTQTTASLDPDAGFEASAGPQRAGTLVIACGALARELLDVLRASRFEHMAITCLPAILHNRPERIVPAVRAKIRANRSRYGRMFCLYGDCGTGGELDRMLAEEGVERIAGAHCYEFLMGSTGFAAAMEAEPGSFFVTDYLARHFDRLVIQGLGIDRFPELLPIYFGHYSRLIHLVQVEDGDLTARARLAADRLGLRFERRWTGLGALDAFLAPSGAIDGAAA